MMREGGCDKGCASCAYREGSVTRTEPYNVLRSLIAVEGAVPFHCHQSFPYRERQPQQSELVVCAGWKHEVAERAMDPQWRQQRRVKHALGVRGMELVDEFVEAKDETHKAFALRDLTALVALLFKKGEITLHTDGAV